MLLPKRNREGSKVVKFHLTAKTMNGKSLNMSVKPWGGVISLCKFTTTSDPFLIVTLFPLCHLIHCYLKNQLELHNWLSSLPFYITTLSGKIMEDFKDKTQ